MVIRISSARHIDTLLQDLTSGSMTVRETAIARLIVVGGRAVTRLLTTVAMPETPTATRLAALRALEGIGDVRALEPALLATSDPDDGVAMAAINVVRTQLSGSQGIAALDKLTEVALNATRHDEVRTTALRALRELAPATIQPVLDTLANDPRQRIRDAADGLDADAVTSGSEELAGGPEPSWPLSDAPEALRRHISTVGEELSLAALHQLLEDVRQREVGSGGQQRREWMGARAAVQVALAKRGSRLGIYDLREALEGASEPLPVEFLAAVTMIGDSSCLEPLAAAYSRSGAAESTTSDWWHHHLSAAFQAIVEREGLTRRHAVARKIDKRWPELLQQLWPQRKG
jgi:HEAT repeat protein